MAQLVVFIAGLLVVAESQASDVADRSRFQGFLSQYTPSGIDASKSSMSANDKFIAPNLKSLKHGNRADALSSHQIADREEKQAVQKLLTNGSTNPISSSVIGMGLLSLVTMLGLHLRRRLQPATVLASSSGLTASALGDKLMEMKSQDSHKMSSSRVGWGQLSSQNTCPSTLCYATEAKADLEALANSLSPSVGFWNPLNIDDGYDNEQTTACYRQPEIKHGRVAMAAFVGYCVQAPAVAHAADDYEYGSVEAPGWVLPAGALLAIATALLPLALQGGEEAAQEIFDQDADLRSLDPRKRK